MTTAASATSANAKNANAKNLRSAIWIAALAAGALAAGAGSSTGQDFGGSPYYDSPPVAAARPQAAVHLSDEQLDAMLGPIALYPDSLLAQVLPAATYPLEVVLAWQWVKANPGAGEAAIDQQAWEPPVKALAHYPTVLQTLAEHADWMQALGAAFLAQQPDVMESVQRLRQAALDAGNLQTTAEQQVIYDDNAVMILPANPQVIYVPEYDPEIVYLRRAERCPIYFRLRFNIGRWLDNDFDWRNHWVAVGGGWHQGWRYEDSRWRPMEGRVLVADGRGITRFTRGPSVVVPLTRPWSHNRAKPIPIYPSPFVGRGGGVRVDVGPAHVEVRGRPYSVPRPLGPMVDTRVGVRMVPGAFGGDGRSRADVDRAVRRADQTRSSWAGQGAAVRAGPVAPARIQAPPMAAPIRTAPPPVRALPARTTTVERSPFVGGSSARETESESSRGHRSLRR